MLRQREMEEQMRRQRDDSYRMGGFMDNVRDPLSCSIDMPLKWISVTLRLFLTLVFFQQREREMRMSGGGAGPMGMAGKRLNQWLCNEMGAVVLEVA